MKTRAVQATHLRFPAGTKYANQYMERVFYINLDKRPDRRLHIESQLAEFGILSIAERFPAIEHEKGNVGCLMSHIAVLKTITERGYKNALILEDDFQFLVDENRFNDLLQRFFCTYGSVYHVVMLAYRNASTQPVDELVGRCLRTFTTSGYMVSFRILDDLIKVMENAVVNFLITRDSQRFSADTCWFPLQRTRNWFFFNERIGNQLPGYSDIENRHTNYGV